MMIIIIEGCGTRAERGALPGGGARGDGSRNPRSPRSPFPAALPGPGGAAGTAGTPRASSPLPGRGLRAVREDGQTRLGVAPFAPRSHPHISPTPGEMRCERKGIGFPPLRLAAAHRSRPRGAPRQRPRSPRRFSGRWLRRYRGRCPVRRGCRPLPVAEGGFLRFPNL